MEQQPNFEYAISIRVTFPESISRVIKQEKERFVSEYGSKYRSEPHITLYLNRWTLDRYTKDGLPELVQNLRELSLKAFEISLLDPKVNLNVDRHRNHYVMGVSNKEQLRELRAPVYNVAVRYCNTLLGGKDQKPPEEDTEEWEPHITLGVIDLDSPQAELAEVEKNVKQVVGNKITVSSIVVFFYAKEPGEEKGKLVEEVIVPFRP